MYEQISTNKWKSGFLMFFFLIFVLGLGYVIGLAWAGPEHPYTGLIGLAIAMIIAFAMAFTSYYHSDKIALAISGAKPVGEGEYIRYRNAVEGLAIAAGIPTPKIYVIESPAMNAFATGRNPERASVAATTGLLEAMDDLELEGVIGHEMSHIKNYDILLQTITIVLVGTVILLSDIFLRSLWFSDDSDDSGGGWIFLIIGIILAILAPIVAQIIQLAISRKREYLADANSALLTRYPLGLASALEKLAGETRQLKTANKATAHLFIVQPLKTQKGTRGRLMNRLFDTHPPIEDRIERLQHMAGDFVPV
ncbi:MAG: M48 family metalloprotease [Actinomycetota bacterium]|nr:M48 family metalloprotease [Actinomycetota bacterium]